MPMWRQRGLGLAGDPPVDPSGLRCVAGLAGSVAGLIAFGLAGCRGAAPVVPSGDGLVFDPPVEPSGLRSAPPALSNVFCDSGPGVDGVCGFGHRNPGQECGGRQNACRGLHEIVSLIVGRAVPMTSGTLRRSPTPPLPARSTLRYRSGASHQRNQLKDAGLTSGEEPRPLAAELLQSAASDDALH